VAIGLTMNRAGATRELCEFVKKHRLPVVTTLMAKGHVPEEGSQLVGVVGRARRDIVAEYYKPADLVLAIGYDPVEFNYEDWVRKDLPLIHIDTVPADIAGGYALAGEVVGDIRAILQALLKGDRIEHEWDLDALKAHRRKLRQALTPPQANFSPHHALLAMRELMPADSFLVADVGAHTHIIGQLWDPKGPGNFLVSNGWSSMGFGIPAAIAAKLLQPTRPVWLVPDEWKSTLQSACACWQCFVFSTLPRTGRQSRKEYRRKNGRSILRRQSVPAERRIRA
jgi:acetolactate synthase-1/2/3 large subunit